MGWYDEVGDEDEGPWRTYGEVRKSVGYTKKTIPETFHRRYSFGLGIAGELLARSKQFKQYSQSRYDTLDSYMRCNRNWDLLNFDDVLVPPRIHKEMSKLLKIDILYERKERVLIEKGKEFKAFLNNARAVVYDCDLQLSPMEQYVLRNVGDLKAKPVHTSVEDILVATDDTSNDWKTTIRGVVTKDGDYFRLSSPDIRDREETGRRSFYPRLVGFDLLAGAPKSVATLDTIRLTPGSTSPCYFQEISKENCGIQFQLVTNFLREEKPLVLLRENPYFGKIGDDYFFRYLPDDSLSSQWLMATTFAGGIGVDIGNHYLKGPYSWEQLLYKAAEVSRRGF